MPYPRGAALARIALEHPGQLLALAGGLGYLLAYTNVRVMAAGLGVGPADLGLTTNDYLMTAAFWVLLFLPLVAVYVWFLGNTKRVGWTSWTGLSTAFGAVAIAVTTVVTIATSVSVRWAFLMSALITITAGIGWWLGGPGFCLVLTISVALLGLGPPASYRWGQELRLHPAATTNKATPLWLKLVLTVEEGQAQFAAGGECTIRMSDRVYVTSESVRVEPAPVAFRSDDCF
jgi:hypothetical protein